MTVLFDTCVIIDVLQAREPFCETSLKAVIAAADGTVNGVLTAKSVTDIHYILFRSLHSRAETLERLKKLFSIFRIADTCAIDCQLALSSQTGDYEDAVMVETARRIGADCIVTRNIKDYEGCGLRVCSPSELLAAIIGE